MLNLTDLKSSVQLLSMTCSIQNVGHYIVPMICLVRVLPTQTIACFKEETAVLHFKTTNFLFPGLKKKCSDVLKFSECYETILQFFIHSKDHLRIIHLPSCMIITKIAKHRSHVHFE